MNGIESRGRVEWKKKMWYIYTMEYCSAIEKNDTICSNMDGPGDYHTKQSKSERERQISYDIGYMRNLKENDMNKLIYKTETDLQT